MSVKQQKPLRKPKKKLKGNIQVSTRSTWFSKAMEELDKEKK